MSYSKAGVLESLGNADYTAEEVARLGVASIVDELRSYDADCEDISAEELTPIVEEWIKGRAK